MLMLTRRAGERIFIIGPDMQEVQICISVNWMDSGRVSLGIDADKTYTILREEVFLREYQDADVKE
jgi:sRNA-binding carbon storage regulator CsrA